MISRFRLSLTYLDETYRLLEELATFKFLSHLLS
jgi:hypothetical protein